MVAAERRRLATVVAAAAMLGGAAAALASRPHLLRVLTRWLTVGLLGGRTAMRAVVHRLRRLGTPPDRRGELDVGFEIRSAEDVVATLGEMKGTFMKVGQMLSFVDDAMPEHIRRVLAQLQDSVAPMAPALAAEVVTDELGAPPERLFRLWESMPIAAASIGQVHRAELHDGTVVAVKVQYPGVAELMEADLAQLDLGRLVAPAIWPNLDAAAVTSELKARLREELDYTTEAANQRDFATWYTNHPFIRIPTVIDELTTRRVLTTTFAEGDRFAQFEGREQAQRDYSAVSWLIHRTGITRGAAVGHAAWAKRTTTHPRVVAALAAGEISASAGRLICVWTDKLPDQARDSLITAVRHIALEPDPVKLRAVLEQVGHFAPGNPLTDEQIFEFSAVLWGYLADDRPTTLTPAWASETVRRYLFKGPKFKHIDRWGGLPVDLVILQRITVGLLAILGRLHATANWHRIARELWLGDAPATPLGEREAEWLASARVGT